MRAYGRRHRSARRRDAQPLMLVADESRLFDAIAALVRTLHRYRSELAPITTALVLDVAGMFLHSTYRAYWPWIATATAGAALLTLLCGAPWRLTRIDERVYAATVTGAAGGWLAAASILSPWRAPMPATLGLLTLTAGIPWWSHRRRRMRVRVDRTISAWPRVAETVGLAGSRVL